MNARGERILIVGDSLSHGGPDSGPTVYDVTQGFNRASSAPGDLLASLFLEQGAQAARVNARVGRSAYNFWQREDANTLIASDRGFAPTKVIVILGTNDVGLDLVKDRAAMEKIRDTYKAMGAEVWAIGPFISAQNAAQTDAVTKMMSSVFGGRFLDGRMFSQLAEHSGDGVHYTQNGARTLALAMGERLLATVSPTIIWTGVAIGAGALLAVGLGLLIGKKMSRTRGVLADIAAGTYAYTTPEHDLSGEMLGAIDIVEGRKHKGSTNDLVRKGYEQVPCASGLDRGSGQARCWAKPIPKRLAGPKATITDEMIDDRDAWPDLPEIRKRKPRPLNKLYGKNPTPEQIAASKAAHNAWNAEYRKASKRYKELVDASNTRYHARNPNAATLQTERAQIYKALEYAGNTDEQVARYHAKLAEIDTKLKTGKSAFGSTRDDGIAWVVKDSASRAPKFGGRKVMISDVYEQIVEDERDGGMSFEEFQRELVRLHKNGSLVLSRADLVAAMDPKKVAASETDAGGATFHFVNLAGLAAAPRTGPNAAIDSRAWNAWGQIQSINDEFPTEFTKEFEHAKAIVKGDDWQWDQREDIVKSFEKTARSIRQRAAKMRKAKPLAGADDDDEEPRPRESNNEWWDRLQAKHAERKRPMREALAKHDALILQSGDRRVLVLKTPEVADVADGAFRVTEFDIDGPIGHTTRKTVDALADELTDTWRPSTIIQATDDDIVKITGTERFSKGSANVIAVQKHNSGRR